MKVEKLLNKAKKELKSDEEKEILVVVKDSIKRIDSVKKTLRKLEQEHKKLLKTDIKDLELDGFEY